MGKRTWEKADKIDRVLYILLLFFWFASVFLNWTQYQFYRDFGKATLVILLMALILFTLIKKIIRLVRGESNDLVPLFKRNRTVGIILVLICFIAISYPFSFTIDVPKWINIVSENFFRIIVALLLGFILGFEIGRDKSANENNVSNEGQ